MMPRFSTRSSTSIVSSPVRKVELRLQDLVEVAWPQRSRAAAARRRDATRPRSPEPSSPSSRPSTREHDGRLVAHDEPELLAVGEHERPVEQHVRRHRREHEAAQRGRRDRAAHRERVGGRAGRRRDDHAVGRVGRERAAVDRHVEADQVAAALLLQRGFVQREPRAGRPRRRRRRRPRAPCAPTPRSRPPAAAAATPRAPRARPR